VGFAAGLALLATLQFVWQMRQGQIDATLCFLTTLGIYGLLRHLLLGPSWGWYCIGWAASGLGIITKGVGFLPILLLIPYALVRAAGWIQTHTKAGRWQWALGPLAMAGAVSLWLAPMLIAASGSAKLARYRDEILFGQTIDRYADAWHHTKPFWYFLVNVIPALWLPLVALIPWLWRDWRASWTARDLRVWAPLAWVVLVLLFFSLSSGKRGVYILPAVPAFVLACAPFLPALAQRRGPRNTVFAIACGIVVVTFLAALWVLFDAEKRQDLVDAYDIDVVGPLFVISGVGAVVCALARPARGFAAYGGLLLASLLIVSFWINPTIDASRSGARFIRNVERLAMNSEELGFVAYREQYLLHLKRSVVNFGHARWREHNQEAYDAAAWLAAKRHRMLLVDLRVRELCFPMATAQDAGQANREQWFLVSGSADAGCAAQGNLGAARTYTPPDSVRGESLRARTDSTG
jgi:4-amino-4-deoxy-L-arabinose transferase-like glycosyltransferase